MLAFGCGTCRCNDPARAFSAEAGGRERRGGVAQRIRFPIWNFPGYFSFATPSISLAVDLCPEYKCPVGLRIGVPGLFASPLATKSLFEKLRGILQQSPGNMACNYFVMNWIDVTLLYSVECIDFLAK